MCPFWEHRLPGCSLELQICTIIYRSFSPRAQRRFAWRKSPYIHLEKTHQVPLVGAVTAVRFSGTIAAALCNFSLHPSFVQLTLNGLPLRLPKAALWSTMSK